MSQPTIVEGSWRYSQVMLWASCVTGGWNLISMEMYISSALAVQLKLIRRETGNWSGLPTRPSIITWHFPLQNLTSRLSRLGVSSSTTRAHKYIWTPVFYTLRLIFRNVTPYFYYSPNFTLTDWGRAKVSVISPEIARASLHIAIPWYTHLYTVPFLSLYPLLAYAYYVKYDQWLVSEEWTFLACVSLGASHALSFLVTKWSAGARAWITTKKVSLPNMLTHRLYDLEMV
jgi:hypothetical protein